MIPVVNAISFTEAQNNLAAVMEAVCNDRKPVMITRGGEPAVVLVSLEEYGSDEETAYLLRSPANAARLLESIAQLEAIKPRRPY